MKRLALIVGALTIASCTKAPAPPSTAFKLVCKSGPQQLVFLMDTVSKTTTLANLPGAPKGTFTTTDYEYRLVFPQTGRVSAGEAVVNRYDGEMIRELGNPPFKLDPFDTPKDNLLYYWKCKREEAKPLL